MFKEPLLPLITAATLLSIIVIVFMASSLTMLVRRQHRKRKQLMQALLDEKENTMRSLSMELHDNISQMLNVAAIQLHRMAEGANAGMLPLIRETVKIIDTVSFDTQHIGHALNPDYVRHTGFIPALMEIAEWLNASGRIHCTVTVEGIRKPLPDQTGLMVFRMAQEALNNIVKYAQATRAGITLSFGERDFLMYVTDDGTGIDRNAAGYKEGMGMSNLRQRAAIVKGSIDVLSTPAAGTSVVLTISGAFVT